MSVLHAVGETRGEEELPLSGNQYLEARSQWIPEHGYVLSLNVERFSELQSDLDAESICSQAIPKVPAAMRRRWMLCFISVKKEQLTHVARSVARYPAESGKDKLDIWNVVPLPRPVRISAIKAKLHGKQAWRARQALDGGHISPSAFPLVMDALRAADDSAGLSADGLIDRRSRAPDPTPTPAKTNWAYQRDAVVTALEIAGIPKDRLLATPQLEVGAPSSTTSIFDSDDDMTTIEDLAILQDLDVADKDWTLVKRQRYPAKTYINGDTKLTIILANKLPLEHQLGVDLIYVNELLKSVVFVQYKMFGGIDGENGYRPDKQLEAEIKRMDKAATKLATIPVDGSCDGYRFALEPFFLKFCSKLLTHASKGHVPGYYIPLGYWKRLVQTPAVIGKKGGTIVHAETLGRRYFNPTHFIDLVSRGWIGTSALQTDILVPYLKDALQGKKGIVLAVQSNDDTSHDKEADAADAYDWLKSTKAPPKSRYPGRKPKTIQL